jgi:hypothetical protein
VADQKREQWRIIGEVVIDARKMFWIIGKDGGNSAKVLAYREFLDASGLANIEPPVRREAAQMAGNWEEIEKLATIDCRQFPYHPTAVMAALRASRRSPEDAELAARHRAEAADAGATAGAPDRVAAAARRAPWRS